MAPSSDIMMMSPSGEAKMATYNSPWYLAAMRKQQQQMELPHLANDDVMTCRSYSNERQYYAENDKYVLTQNCIAADSTKYLQRHGLDYGVPASDYAAFLPQRGPGGGVAPYSTIYPSPQPTALQLGFYGGPHDSWSGYSPPVLAGTASSIGPGGADNGSLLAANRTQPTMDQLYYRGVPDDVIAAGGNRAIMTSSQAAQYGSTEGRETHFESLARKGYDVTRQAQFPLGTVNERYRLAQTFKEEKF